MSAVGDRDRESAVLVPVPAAEPVVGEHRARLDPAAAWGVPAHVTVLYPFVAPDDLDDGVLGRLAAVVSAVPAFDCRFASTRWFGDEVVWLEPAPAEPFRALTRGVWEEFPAYPPYGGVHDVVVPHLTVGGDLQGRRDELAAAEAAVQAALPLSTYLDRVWLMVGSRGPGSWRLHTELALGHG